MSIDEMPAGREMDKLIAEKVMGWQSSSDGASMISSDGGRWDASSDDWWCPYYSADIAAAWEVVNKLTPEWCAHFYYYGKQEGWCRFEKLNKDGDVSVSHENDYDCDMPLAICRAALKAVANA